MKKYLFSIALFSGLQLSAQTLFTYGNKAVSKEEFLRQFSRNLNPAEDRNKALQDYLPLYINYKLKVQDAYDKKLDTQYTQLAELTEFRRQIEDNYFSQQANLDDLIKEAAERSKKDIQLQDVYIGFNPADPASADSAAALAAKAYQKLKSGVAFDKVVEEYTTDADLKASNGSLGWITVFSLPYRIESDVYPLAIGNYTQPVRTRTAFHIFKKISERKALGKVQVAQILLPFPPEAAPETKIALQQEADSVYQLLQKGADFGQLAAKVSNDKTSYQNGGILPAFGIGTYEKTFEDAAFSLKKKGDITRPFATSYGVHIIKLLGTEPAGDSTSAEVLRQRVAADNRMEQAKTTLIKKLLPSIGYQPNKLLTKQQIRTYTDSSIFNSTTPVKGINDNTELYHFAKQSIKAGEWMKFIRAMRVGNTQLASDYDGLMNQYINATAAEYYKSHLEDYSAAFKNQMQEFKDANLNFEVTQKMVWEKASADSVGLNKYYAANKPKYQWGPSANAIIVTGTDRQSADSARRMMEKDIRIWRPIVSSMETHLLADSNRFEQSQIPAQPGQTLQLQAGSFTPTILNAQDSSATFSYIVNVVPQPGQRSFEEARGFVINDYQQVLEKQWMGNLKKKYPVKVNDAVWNGMVKK